MALLCNTTTTQRAAASIMSLPGWEGGGDRQAEATHMSVGNKNSSLEAKVVANAIDAKLKCQL